MHNDTYFFKFLEKSAISILSSVEKNEFFGHFDTFFRSILCLVNSFTVLGLNRTPNFGIFWKSSLPTYSTYKHNFGFLSRKSCMAWRRDSWPLTNHMYSWRGSMSISAMRSHLSFVMVTAGKNMRVYKDEVVIHLAWVACWVVEELPVLVTAVAIVDFSWGLRLEDIAWYTMADGDLKLHRR